MRQMVAAVVAVAASGGVAQAERLETLVRVSGASPFAQCTLDRVAEQPGGQNYLHSEVEPQIAVNPRNPNNVVALYQQDRWSNGGSRGLVASVSFDGGETWEQVVVPGLSLCSGGRYQRATDPWLSFSRTGELHLISLSLDIGRDGTPVGAPNALLVSRSADGGLSWTEPIPIVSETSGPLHDKESITADPTDPTGALVYAAWDRFNWDGSKAFFARSTDGGRSWEPARMPYDPGLLGFSVGHQIVVLPDGVLLNVFTEAAPGPPDSGRQYFLAIMRSADKGASWSRVARVLELRPPSVREPDHGQESVRTAEDLVDVAVDPRSGRVYAVWQDGGREWSPTSRTGTSHILFAESLDGGVHWSEPIRVDRAVPVFFAQNLQAFTPSVAVAADGTIGVTYYDFRRNDQRPGAHTDYWIVECLPARPGTCAHADNWDEELRLTRGAFDLRAAPVDRGYFLGDYEGLDADVLDFLALFAATDGSDPASIFFRRLSP